MTAHTDWADLDDERLLEAACALIDQGRLPPQVLALVTAVLLTPPAPRPPSSASDP